MGDKNNPISKEFGMIASKKKGTSKKKMASTKEDNLALMARTKKERKPYAPKNTFCAKKKEIRKGMDKSKLIFLYCKKAVHFIQDCNTRKIKKRE